MGRPKRLHHRPRGGARPQDVEPPRLHPAGDLGGDTAERFAVAAHPARLHVLGEVGGIRHWHIPIKPGRDGAGTKGLLVDIHDLPRPRLDILGQRAEREVGGGARAGGIDRRVHLHPGRDADHGHPVAVIESGRHVARGAVAAGEEDEPRTGDRHGLGRGARVRRAGLALGRSADDDRAKARVSGNALAHLTGGAEKLQAGPGSGERIQHHRRPLCRLRLRATGACFAQDRRRVGALEPDAPAHAGDGVDDEAERRPAQGRPISRNRRPRDRPGRA